VAERERALYTAQQVKDGERKAAAELDLDMYELMENAGTSVFEYIQRVYPSRQTITVYCGTGNNGGDGYVVARLAKQSGYHVILVQLGQEKKLSGDAKTAQQRWIRSGGLINSHSLDTVIKSDLIVDALLGTGFSGEVADEYSDAISDINNASIDVISVDLPSGLCADTGHISNHCINAKATITFVGLKRGLYTGQAPDHTGNIVFSGLGISDVFSKVSLSKTKLINKADVDTILLPRSRTAHKGHHGRVVCLGGDRGMFGAIRLTSEACSRVGAGLTRVVTQPENVSALVSARPEIMVFDWRGNSNEINDHLEWCDVIALGPGMGNTSWGRSLVGYSRTVEKPVVQDADALALLAKVPDFNRRRVITPHPGEAARLLNNTIEDVERDRFASVKMLQLKYGGVVVLKGAGTIIYDGSTYWVCNVGNPGMATGGMGDVLTGIIAGLIAQGLSLSKAACLGVWIHSTAADVSAREEGERGMLASDLFPYIRRLANGR